MQRLSGTLMTQLLKATNRAWWSLSSSRPRTLRSSWPWTLHLDTQTQSAKITRNTNTSVVSQLLKTALTWMGCRHRCPPAVWIQSCHLDACWPKPSGLVHRLSPGTSPFCPYKARQKHPLQSGSTWTYKEEREDEKLFFAEGCQMQVSIYFDELMAPILLQTLWGKVLVEGFPFSSMMFPLV